MPKDAREIIFEMEDEYFDYLAETKSEYLYKSSLRKHTLDEVLRRLDGGDKNIYWMKRKKSK